MIDLLIKETGDGGALVVRGNDFVPVTGIENMVYLSLFGGDDWWGNDVLLAGEDATVAYHCQTERVLRETALNSAGRLAIQRAVLDDLKWVGVQLPGTVVRVEVRITSDDRVELTIWLDGVLLRWLWNPEGEELEGGVVTGGRVHGDEYGDEYE
jgi:hypothetical protein